MKVKEFILEAAKPRNFVAKNAMKTTSGAGAHKDKKRAEKQGDVKHKNKFNYKQDDWSQDFERRMKEGVGDKRSDPAPSKEFVSNKFYVKFTPTGIEFYRRGELVHTRPGDYSNPTRGDYYGAKKTTDILWNKEYRQNALSVNKKNVKEEIVSESYDSEELANEVYAEFERMYPNLARRADERMIHAAIMDVLNYGGDNDPSALAQDVARAVKRNMKGVAESKDKTKVKEALSDTSLQALKKAKQDIEKSREADVSDWEKDFKQNFASKFVQDRPSTAPRPSKKKEFSRPSKSSEKMGPPKHLRNRTYPEVLALGQKAFRVADKVKALEKLKEKAEKMGLFNDPGLKADVDIELYMQNPEEDDYEALDQKLDAATELLKGRIELKRSLYSPRRSSLRNSIDNGGDVLEQAVSELSSELLGRYKKAAGDDARKSDKEGNFDKGHKRFKGIVKATLKQFDNDAKGKK